MLLLTNVMEHSLDDGYAEAAARREADGRSGMPCTLKAKLGFAACLVLAALVVTLGAAQARVTAPVLAKERQELIDRIDAETAAADTLETQVEEVRDDVSKRQRKALQEHGGDQGELVALLSGATPVQGPGIKVVVDDAEDTDQGAAGPARPAASPTPGGSGTGTCSASSTACGSPAPRPSRSTDSG